MGEFTMSNRRDFIKHSVLLSGGALTLGLFPNELFASGELVKLTVVHTNDIHYHLEPFPESEHP